MTRMPSDLFTGLLRTAGIRHQRVTFGELFFDLVYAFAVTQIVITLIEDLSLHQTFRSGLLLLAVWWTWIGTVWVTNWVDPGRRPVRIMLFALMGLSLVMSAVIPNAFDDHGWIFAVCYVVSAIGRFGFLCLCSDEQPLLRLNFSRVMSWFVASGVFWIAGAFADGTIRDVLWVVALGIDYLGPVVGFVTPKLGRSTTADWPVSGGYFAERFQLFILIVLGETIVDTGAAFSSIDVGWREAAALMIAFAGTTGIWWIYFDRSAVLGGRLMEEADDPGRLARAAYTYWHLPMVGGIMLAAVGDQLSISNPRGDTSLAMALVSLGGPALFLVGYYVFNRIAFGHSESVVIAALVFLAICLPLATIVPPLVVGLVSTLAVLGVACWMIRALPEGALDSSPEPVGSSSEAVF